MSREALLQGVTFAFHCVPPSERHRLTLLLHEYHGTLYDARNKPDFVYVITSYWTDCAPGAALANVPLRLVTRFWLFETLRLGRLLRVSSHSFFRPPVRPHTLWLHYPLKMDDDTKLHEPRPKVFLPCSPRFLYRGEVPLWPYIAAKVAQPIANIPDLLANLQLMAQCAPRRPFNCLEYAMNELLTAEEKSTWFHVVLPKMKQLVLQMPHLFATLPFLLPPCDNVALGNNARVATQMYRFTKLQVLTLICGCFFGIFPAQNSANSGTLNEGVQRKKGSDHLKDPSVEFPSFSATRMFSALNSKMMVLKGHKIRCLLQYFLQVVPRAIDEETVLITEVIDFTRVAVHVPGRLTHSHTPHEILAMLYPTTKEGVEYPLLGTAHCVSNTLIEDLDEHLQIDFANEFAGGGVLNAGCVQEEIRFLMSPELFVSCLVFAKLESHEAFVVHGTERFCTYKGYGGTFNYTGAYQDGTPREPLRADCFRRKSIVVGIDATDYSSTQVERQYLRNHVWRDLVKAYAGFAYCTKDTRCWSIGTGNWGCGVFRGDSELKFLIQWLAASLHHRSLTYVLFAREEALQNKVNLLLKVARSFNAQEWERQRRGLTLWLITFLFQEVETEGRAQSVLTRALVSLQRSLAMYQVADEGQVPMESGSVVQEVPAQREEGTVKRCKTQTTMQAFDRPKP